MSRSEAQNRTDLEPRAQTSSKPLLIQELWKKSYASTVNRNNLNQSTVLPKSSVIDFEKRKADLTAAIRLLELEMEKKYIEKELKVNLARLNAKGNRASMNDDSTSHSREQERLSSTEPHGNEEQHNHETTRTGSTELTETTVAEESSKLRTPIEMKELQISFGRPEPTLVEEVQEARHCAMNKALNVPRNSAAITEPPATPQLPTRNLRVELDRKSENTNLVYLFGLTEEHPSEPSSTKNLLLANSNKQRKTKRLGPENNTGKTNKLSDTTEKCQPGKKKKQIHIAFNEDYMEDIDCFLRSSRAKPQCRAARSGAFRITGSCPVALLSNGDEHQEQSADHR